MLTEIEKVKRQSVADQVYEILINKISNKEWKSGEKIPSEIELAQSLGVSRVTLKYALQKLNALGIIETRVGEGSFVSDYHFSSLFAQLLKSNTLIYNSDEINQFRIMLEYCTLRLAVLNDHTDTKLKDLEASLKLMEENIDIDEEVYHREHYNFHYTICKMSGNKFFLQLYDALNQILFDVYKANSKAIWKYSNKTESIQHHKEILKGLKSKDLALLTKIQDDLLLDEYLKNPS